MTQPPKAAERVAIVVNPTKLDDASSIRGALTDICADFDVPEPGWYETTEDDPGTGQTEQAIADGANLICSLGGDGTVRAVAQALVGRDDAVLGLLPGGTGNLLARNLGLPVDDISTAMRAVLEGKDRVIDTGEVVADDDEPQLFLVMVGMGLDAETMDGASEEAKAKAGWLAYLGSGAKALLGKAFEVQVGSEAGTRRSQHARSVLVGNCGTIQGGIKVLPHAEVDDGLLDAMVLAPHGPVGWGPSLIRRLTRDRRGHRRHREEQSKTFLVLADEPVLSQIDGDVIGPRRRLACVVRPDSLTVRAPEQES